MARWYDPMLGHFTQADSIVPEPGKTESYDRYAYVENNPFLYVDPSGHDAGGALAMQLGLSRDEVLSLGANTSESISEINQVLDRYKDQFNLSDKYSYKTLGTINDIFGSIVEGASKTKNIDIFGYVSTGFGTGGGYSNIKYRFNLKALSKTSVLLIGFDFAFQAAPEQWENYQDYGLDIPLNEFLADLIVDGGITAGSNIGGVISAGLVVKAFGEFEIPLQSIIGIGAITIGTYMGTTVISNELNRVVDQSTLRNDLSSDLKYIMQRKNPQYKINPVGPPIN